MLHYAIVETVILADLIGMHKTGCSGETCTYLAHHELESVSIIIIVNTAPASLPVDVAYTAPAGSMKGKEKKPFGVNLRIILGCPGVGSMTSKDGKVVAVS